MRRLSFNKVLFDIKINMVLLMHHQITRHQMDLTLGIGRLHKGYKLGCLRQRLLSSPLKRGLGGYNKLHAPLSPPCEGGDWGVVNLVVATPHSVNRFNLRNLCPIFGCGSATQSSSVFNCRIQKLLYTILFSRQLCYCYHWLYCYKNIKIKNIPWKP